MTSKESFDKLHEIESRLKEWETLEERDEMEKEREQAIKDLVPEVGLKCTICYYSDYRAATVTEVITARKVAVRFNATKCLDYYAGRYNILPELEGGTKIFTKRSNGKWIQEGQYSRDGVRLALHYQRHYIDPHF